MFSQFEGRSAVILGWLLSNLVPRVLGLFGQRKVARRDSGKMEFKNFFDWPTGSYRGTSYLILEGDLKGQRVFLYFFCVCAMCLFQFFFVCLFCIAFYSFTWNTSKMNKRLLNYEQWFFDRTLAVLAREVYTPRHRTVTTRQNASSETWLLSLLQHDFGKQVYQSFRGESRRRRHCWRCDSWNVERARNSS